MCFSGALAALGGAACPFSEKSPSIPRWRQKCFCTSMSEQITILSRQDSPGSPALHTALHQGGPRHLHFTKRVDGLPPLDVAKAI